MKKCAVKSIFFHKLRRAREKIRNRKLDTQNCQEKKQVRGEKKRFAVSQRDGLNALRFQTFIKAEKKSTFFKTHRNYLHN